MTGTPHRPLDARQAWLGVCERDLALGRPERLHERIEAMDRLDALLCDDRPGIRQRAATLLTQWEAANQAIFRDIRHAIRRGEGPAALNAWLRTLANSISTS